MIGILLYVLAGVAFGYALRGVLAWILALGIVALFGVGTVLMSGFDDFRLPLFVLVMLLTAGGVLLGRFLAERLGGASTVTKRTSPA